MLQAICLFLTSGIDTEQLFWVWLMFAAWIIFWIGVYFRAKAHANPGHLALAGTSLGPLVIFITAFAVG